MERVVQRSELRSASNSPPSSPDFRVNQALKDVPRFDFVKTPGSLNTHPTEHEAEDEELNFRLFSAPTPKTSSAQQATAQKIRLRSPSADAGEPGFLQAGRDQSYYFSFPLAGQEKENVACSALTGVQVHANAQSIRPGSQYPWKVLTLPRSSQAKDIQASAPELWKKLVNGETLSKRTRPGKKYRLRLRVKQAARMERQTAAKSAAEAKEAAEREKRTQKNREKKVKQRLRDKAKKNAANAQEVNVGSDAVDET